jgi:ABC-type amino acid transport substrate-binding protein
MRIETMLLLGAVAVLPLETAMAEVGLLSGRDTLKVLVAGDELPEMYELHEGSLPGLEREMIEGFARAHHLKVEVVPIVPFNQVVPALLKGQGDIIVGIIETESRRKQIDFTVETLPTRHVIVTHKPHASIQRVEALRSVQVGVLQGTSWAEAASAAGVPPANTTGYQELKPLLLALSSGKIAATVMSVSDYALVHKHDPDLEAGAFLGAPGHGAWGVKKSDGDLLRTLNQHIETLRSSPAWNGLVVKYLGEDSLVLLARARKQ